MSKLHPYTSHVIWTGNTGYGTRSYTSYSRNWDIAVPNKSLIHCSNDPLLGGDPTLMNPEDLLVSSLSACHMLWYLHFASEANIIVHEYQDNPIALGTTAPSGAGHFVKATLNPSIVIEHGNDIDLAYALHDKIHDVCFIARPVNFPVTYEPTIRERT